MKQDRLSRLVTESNMETFVHQMMQLQSQYLSALQPDSAENVSDIIASWEATQVRHLLNSPSMREAPLGIPGGGS